MLHDNCCSASSRGSQSNRKEHASGNDVHVASIPEKLRLNIAADPLKISRKLRYQSVGLSAWGIDTFGVHFKNIPCNSDISVGQCFSKNNNKVQGEHGCVNLILLKGNKEFCFRRLWIAKRFRHNVVVS